MFRSMWGLWLVRYRPDFLWLCAQLFQECWRVCDTAPPHMLRSIPQKLYMGACAEYHGCSSIHIMKEDFVLLDYLYELHTKNSSGDEIPKRDIALFCLLPLLRLTPPTEGFPCDDLRKILHVGQKCLRYKMAKKYCRKFQPPEYGAHTLQTTDNRRIYDGKTRR